MSQIEHTTGLAVPSSNTTRPATGNSEAASRAETLTNHFPPEKVSQEQVAPNGGDETVAPSIRDTKGSNEKERAEQTVTVTDTEHATTTNGGVQNDDEDRYLTGWKLFLVFVYVLFLALSLCLWLTLASVVSCCPSSLVSLLACVMLK